MKNLFFWFIFCFGLIVLMVGVSFGVTIRQVHCFLNDQAVNADFPVCRQLQTLIGSRLMFRDFSQDQAVSSLLYEPSTKKAYTLIRSEKSLIGTVTFYVSDQPPLFRLQQAEQQWLVSQSGSKQENNDQIVVPLVIDQAPLYDQNPRAHFFLATFLTALGEDQRRITHMTLLSTERFEAEIPGFPTIVMELDQDPQLAATRLSIILRELNPREVDVGIRELDLRFDLPVLRTAVSTDSGQVLIDSQE